MANQEVSRCAFVVPAHRRCGFRASGAVRRCVFRGRPVSELKLKRRERKGVLRGTWAFAIDTVLLPVTSRCLSARNSSLANVM
jgi:hypothetical protein